LRNVTTKLAIQVGVKTDLARSLVALLLLSTPRQLSQLALRLLTLAHFSLLLLLTCSLAQRLLFLLLLEKLGCCLFLALLLPLGLLLQPRFLFLPSLFLLLLSLLMPRDQRSNKQVN
jgi:hypothetical protein